MSSRRQIAERSGAWHRTRGRPGAVHSDRRAGRARDVQLPLIDARVTSRVDRRGYALRRLLLGADVTAVLAAFLVVALHAGALGGSAAFIDKLPLLAFGAPMWAALAHAHGLYHVGSRNTEHGVAEEAGPILHMATMWAWALLIIVKLAGIGALGIGELVVFWLLAMLLLASFRAAVREWARRRSWYVENTVVLGIGHDVSAIVRKIERHPEWGLRVVACVDYAEGPSDVEYIDRVPVLRGDIDVLNLIEKCGVQRVMVAWSSHFTHTREERFALVRELSNKNIHVNLLPNWVELIGSRLEVRELEGMPVLTVPPMRLSRSSLLLKRGLDVVVSGLALAVMSPLLVAVAIAIKLDSPGPVFFRQRRIGREGRPFELLKFRSMTDDADARKHEVADLNSHGPGIGDGMFKVKQDPRITRVGALLRRTSLDEIPQLWNILHGDMSLVGPRPLIEHEARQVSGRFRRRLEIPPGLTGLWQVHGRSEIPFEQMVNLDYLYVTSWSLWSDLKILIKTVPAVASSRGAY